MKDSGPNVSGGAGATELALFTANAAAIDAFLGSGGGLFSQANGFGWVTALLPGLTITDLGGGGAGGGISLTAAGNAPFPGLTNADLSSGPYHNVFGGDLGGVSVLGTANGSTSPSVAAGTPVILGAAGGSVTNPDNPIPEPATLVLLGTALGPMLGYRRLRRRKAPA